MLKDSQTAEIILSALPYIHKFRDEIFVIKYGGSAQIDDKLKSDFARDIVLLQIVGIKIVIVHGGGKSIDSFLTKLNIESKFINGLRFSDKATMEVVEMVLSGLINKEIVALLNSHRARAVGLSGKDDNMLFAKAIDFDKFGYVGQIESVNVDIIKNLLDNGKVPVVAPIAIDDKLQSYNINADLCASAIAKTFKSKKVIFLTDTKGVLDKDGNLISSLDKDAVRKLKQDGVISGGMIPKVDACLECVESGVESAHIIDGRVSHSLLLEIFTDIGIGSVIK